MTSAPLAYLKFDEGSGSVALDSSGNGYTGTLSGGVTYTTTTAPVAAPNLFAAEFDGATGKVLMPATAPISMTQAATFDVWFYLKELPSDAGHSMHIIGRQGSGNDLEWNVNLDNRIHYYIGGGTQIVSTTVFQTNRWYRVTSTYEANTAMTLYVNCVQDISMNIGFTRGDSGNPISIGEGIVFTGRHLNGIIDDVHVYDSVRIPSDCFQLFLPLIQR